MLLVDLQYRTSSCPNLSAHIPFPSFQHTSETVFFTASWRPRARLFPARIQTPWWYSFLSVARAFNLHAAPAFPPLSQPCIPHVPYLRKHVGWMHILSPLTRFSDVIPGISRRTGASTSIPSLPKSLKPCQSSTHCHSLSVSLLSGSPSCNI